MLLDTMPGCGALAGFAAEAAGDDDRYEGACDDEVAGAISAWDRVEAYAAARKHAAAAEFIRRRPRPGSPVDGPTQMPEDWDVAWMSCAPAPTWTCCSAGTHVPARTAPRALRAGSPDGSP